MSRKTAIAEWIGCDVAEIEPYQAGRSRPQIYQYEGAYYVAIKGNGKLPDAETYEWKLMTNAEWHEKRTGFKVYAAI